MNRLVNLTLSNLFLLFFSFTANAQISLYENDSNSIYPIIYFPNRVIYLDNNKNIDLDFQKKTNYINSYIIKKNQENNEILFDEIPEATFSKISNQVYLLYINKDFNNLFLNLNSTFHGAWDVKYLSKDNLIGCEEIKKFDKFKMKECISNFSIFDEIEILFKNKKEINKTHHVSNSIFNTWSLSDIKKGTYIVYFRVQTYFLLTLFLFFSVFFLSIIIIFYYFIKSLIQYTKLKIYKKKKLNFQE